MRCLSRAGQGGELVPRRGRATDGGNNVMLARPLPAFLGVDCRSSLPTAIRPGDAQAPYGTAPPETGPEASATSGAAQPRTHESLIDPFSCVRAGCRRGLDNPHLRRRRLAATGSRRRRRINSYTSRPDTTEQFARTRHHPWSGLFAASPPSTRSLRNRTVPEGRAPHTGLYCTVRGTG